MSAIISHLLKEQRLTPEALRQINEERLLKRRSLLELIIAEQIITEDELFSLVRNLIPCSLYDFTNFSPDIEALKLIPFDLASYFNAFPIKKDEQTLWIAVGDPSDTQIIDEIRFLTNHEVNIVLSKVNIIKELIIKHYRSVDSVKDILENTLRGEKLETQLNRAADRDNLLNLAQIRGDESSIIRLVNKIISDAVDGRASDIHLEPQEKFTEVRYRRDGLLKSIIKFPAELHPRIIARIKIMSRLDIAEQRKVQEGRIQATIDDRNIDLRVSMIPLFHGEKVVFRILDAKNAQFQLSNLGFEKKDIDLFKDALQKTQGVILVTGPTGSGKTTTLYSALRHIKNETINIVTIEDPIEYLLDGINQLQLSQHKDVTFANALKSILRQDPDVILVGEVRDAETAEVAFQAALTGHLVFSTLHTNQATAAIPRLFNIGLEPYLIASSLSMVVAQRLVRVVCSKCKEEYVPDGRLLAKFAKHLDRLNIKRFEKGKGCAHCQQTGYWGRTSLFEILRIDDEIRNLISNRVPEEIIFRKAIEKGMRTMVESGLSKVLKGITTLEEVVKVTDVIRERDILSGKNNANRWESISFADQ